MYHDAIFEGGGYDPTDASYPGSITIRRFADLADPHVARSRTVVDIGCGPGEITCELARRHPQVTFRGIDHSATAIARARELAGRLQLSNVTFDVTDGEAWRPGEPVDLVVLFDAFHHVLQPRQFIDRLGAFTSRFFLIEPAGNWYGGWQQEANLDWIPESLFLIRDRLEYQFALAPDPGTAGANAAPAAGDPVERRYPIEDFEALFAGYAVDILGTVAGIERYGRLPAAASPLRRDIGEITYRLFADLDGMLRKHDLDLSAKHWALYAERGAGGVRRRQRVHLPGGEVQTPLAGSYDAAYTLDRPPAPIGPGAEFHVTVQVANRSWRTWSSDGEHPIYLSSRVIDARGVNVIADGPRTPFPRPVPPGESCQVYLRVQAPAAPGQYTVLVDGVHEGVAWFSESGVPPLTFTLVVP